MEKNQKEENTPTKRKVGQKYIYIYSSYHFSRVFRCFLQFIFVRDKNTFDRDKNKNALFCPADKNPSGGW